MAYGTAATRVTPVTGKVCRVIRFDHVTKTYPTSTRPALNDVTLEIPDGEFVFLIGASGSGKSSFLQLMIREENVTSGDIYFGDFHVNALSGKQINTLRQSIGYVFQDFRLLPNLNVYDNVAFALEVIGKPKDRIAKLVPEALELVGLGAKANRMPRELSGGDEPTGNLDPGTADEIMALLARINRMGTTVVMSTHNARAVDDMRKRVIELQLGKVVRDEQNGVYGDVRK